MSGRRPLPAFAGPQTSPMPALLETEAMNLFTHGLRVWTYHREFRRVLAELEAYSDRELRDMGLTRNDLPRVAYDEAERRIVTPATVPSATLVPAA